MLTTFYPPYSFGGDAMHVYRLSNLLARRGHRVTVVHAIDAYRALTGTEPQGSFLHEPDVTVIPVRSRLGRAAPVLTYLSGRPMLTGRSIQEVLRQKRFDVIHFHNVSLLGGPGILSYGDAPKLYTMHEHWLVCPMHVLWKNNRELCVDPHCLRCTLAFHRPPQLWRYTNLLDTQLEHVDAFLAPSRFVAQAHHDRGFTRPIRHLPHFLPSTAAATTGSAPVHDRPYFLFAGRLEKLKGVDVLIDRFRSYLDADLLIAGEGNHGGALRRSAAGMDNVRFLGHLHPSDLPPLYREATALVVPSVGYEVFPIVILEAFAQRTPVIVNDVGPLPEIVRESGGGRVYRTADDLLAALEELQQHPQRRRELGEAGHRAWLRLWSEEPHLSGYFEAIEAAQAHFGR
jgi:glycosyltransferase involved in cell wall biosynthesis